MDFKDSRTFQNLVDAFVGESQARNRYTYYASVAKNEGHQAIQNIFISTADNEKEHAKVFYKFLQKYAGDQAESFRVTGEYPLNLRDTLANLKSAAAGEGEEVEVYSKFADIADEEGFKDIAVAFRKIASVEGHHENRYANLAKNLENGTLYKKEEKLSWKCENCGYVHEGADAPDLCPACEHPQGYFKPLPEVY
ncbi:rubrerythrin [Desulfitobacterium dichloroeliminans LMG P-21439]|uniref:Rubrerythrin n=1 Tax=Desulfitobacterium dichloroeliminans (strain LMG P-21439 / DCA1) TaxID=871963 RepID=L0F4G5_DESDL|nr:rubrerythrin family protein [Desulfitobacterium dichloroeliminans]AGA67940.1 rubrerythrin [Desulfitobacterium dichloroeliminans LMG P-21439]